MPLLCYILGHSWRFFHGNVWPHHRRECRRVGCDRRQAFCGPAGPAGRWISEREAAERLTLIEAAATEARQAMETE